MLEVPSSFALLLDLYSFYSAMFSLRTSFSVLTCGLWRLQIWAFARGSSRVRTAPPVWWRTVETSSVCVLKASTAQTASGGPDRVTRGGVCSCRYRLPLGPAELVPGGDLSSPLIVQGVGSVSSPVFCGLDFKTSHWTEVTAAVNNLTSSSMWNTGKSSLYQHIFIKYAVYDIKIRQFRPLTVLIIT